MGDDTPSTSAASDPQLPPDERERYFDIINTFYRRPWDPEKKCRYAVKYGLQIQKECVPVIRQMYLDGTLGFGDKKYIIDPYFEDPGMIPVPNHPGYEYNPKFAREYARPIQIRRQWDNISVPKPAKKYTPQQIARAKHIRKMREEMKIPEPNVKNTMRQWGLIGDGKDYCDDEEQKIYDHFRFENGILTEVKSMSIDVYDDTVPVSVEYKDTEDGWESVPNNCAEIEITVEERGRNEKVEGEKRKKKIQEFLRNIRFNTVIRSRVKKNTVENNERMARQNPNPLSSHRQTRDFLDRQREKEELAKEDEERRAEKPLASGAEADQLIIDTFVRKGSDENAPDYLEEEIVCDYEPYVQEEFDEELSRLKVAEISEDILNEKEAEHAETSGAVDEIVEKSVRKELEKVNKTFPYSFDLPISRRIVGEDVDDDNPWSDIVRSAEDQFWEKNSRPHSIISAPSAYLLDRVAKPRASTSDALSVIVTESIASTSASSSTHFDETQSTDVPSTSEMRKKGKERETKKRKKGGRPRKEDYLKKRLRVEEDSSNAPLTVVNVIQPEIVVETTIPPAQPHLFPRPDLHAFTNQKTDTFPRRRGIKRFLAEDDAGGSSRQSVEVDEQGNRPPSIILEENQFVRPDLNRFVADCQPVKKRNKRVETAAAAAAVGEVVQEELLEETTKRKSRLSVNDEDEVSSGSSLLPPPAARPSRHRRSYLSKNNPKPRNRRTEELAGDEESTSSRNVGTANDSDDAMSRASTHVSVNRLLGTAGGGGGGGGGAGINSTTSSVVGDFEDLMLQGKLGASVSHSFGDPQSPPEVTIDEDDQKPNRDELATPPPITDESRKSMKRKKKEKAMKQPKREPEEDCVMVDAAYKIPRTFPEPVYEIDIEPPKIKYIPPEMATMDWLLSKKMFEQINSIFTSDPEQFCKLVLCLKDDTKMEGKTFKTCVQIKNRKSDFTPEFIDFLGKSPKDGELSDTHLLDYSFFTSEFRRKCALPDVFKAGMTPNQFFDLIDQTKEVKDRMLRYISPNAMSTAEREILTHAENIVIGRIVESTMKMASLSTIEWATRAHIKRRFELLLHGWIEFLRKGGLLRVVVAMSGRDDLKPVNEQFLANCKKLIEQNEENLRSVHHLLDMSTDEFVSMFRADNGVTVTEYRKCANSMKIGGDEINRELHCTACEYEKAIVWFDDKEAYDLHLKLHGNLECSQCFDQFPNRLSFLMHQFVNHWSIEAKDS